MTRKLGGLKGGESTTYPALSVMALDIRSIPAMEAEPEPLFSDAKATTTDKRNQMKAETLESLRSSFYSMVR